MKNKCKASILGAALVSALLLTITLPRLAVATTPFPEWSNSSLDLTPSGRIFLGRFWNESVSLTVPNLPSHNQVTVTFRLFLIGSWNGNYIGGDENPYDHGLDQWKVAVVGSTTFPFITTFNNNDCCETQAYPDAYPGGENPPWSGATEVNQLGYGQDSVYEISKTFDHTGSKLQSNFSAAGLGGWWGYRSAVWGLDYVKVEADSQMVYEIDFDKTITATNDLRANATVISALPFNDMINTRDATTSSDDPTSCAGANSHSVWYSYTPDKDRLIEVNSDSSTYAANIAVFSGSNSSLSQVACGGGSVLFDAVAGNTYYIMVGGDGGILRLRVDQPYRLTTTFTGGSVDRSGTATINGTVECNKPGWIYNFSNGSLAQRAGRFRVISGSFGIDLNAECSPTAPVKWSVKVSGDGPFNSGSAAVGANVYSCDSDGYYCDSPRAEATIRLKKQ